MRRDGEFASDYVKVNVLSSPEEAAKSVTHLKYFADFNPGTKAQE